MILGNLEPQRWCWKWCSWATFRLINSGGLGRLQALTIKSTNGLKTPNCKRYLFLTKGRILGFPEKHHHKHTRIYILRFKTEVKPAPGIYIYIYIHTTHAYYIYIYIIGNMLILFFLEKTFTLSINVHVVHVLVARFVPANGKASPAKPWPMWCASGQPSGSPGPEWDLKLD